MQPHHKIVVTFFSPSGYEVVKGNRVADWVFYLPLDTRRNATRFLDAVQPVKVIFVKYEFWYNFLRALKRRNIPTYVVSATFHPAQPFFKWYGAIFRRMLRMFTLLFVQNQASAALLAQIGVTNVVVAGDSRFDRVRCQAQRPCTLPIVEAFCGANDATPSKEVVCVAGSTWPTDEALLFQALKALQGDSRESLQCVSGESLSSDSSKSLPSDSGESLSSDSSKSLQCVSGESLSSDSSKSLPNESPKANGRFKLILVPHEVDSAHIESIMKQFAPFSPVRYSELSEAVKSLDGAEKSLDGALRSLNDPDKSLNDSRVLVIDTIGLLSSLYRFGSFAFVGGGFEHGIHNTLEAAVYGIPVIFGPKYEKFNEAVDLIRLGGAHAIHSRQEVVAQIESWLSSPEMCAKEGRVCAEYVEGHIGATDIVLHAIVSGDTAIVSGNIAIIQGNNAIVRK